MVNVKSWKNFYSTSSLLGYLWILGIQNYNTKSTIWESAEQLKQIDVNDLVVNANKYFNESGDFVSKEISKSSKIYKENPSPKNSLKDEVLSSVNLLKIPGARGKILEESKKQLASIRSKFAW